MTTLRQLEANRKNALQSTGPVTEAGKKKSRANSLRHALAAETLSLPEDVELVAARVASYSEEFSPQGDAETRLVEQVALDSVRVERCQLEEGEIQLETILSARMFWDEDRRADAEGLAAKLVKKPGLVTLQLERTAQGCALKAERWESLLALLEGGSPWDEAHREGALNLLGVPREFRSHGLTKIDPKRGSGDSALELQRALATAELERIREKRATWLDAFDEMKRQDTANGLAYPSREVWLIRRYESACTRRMDAALKTLRECCRYRRPVRTEPAEVEFTLSLADNPAKPSAPLAVSAAATAPTPVATASPADEAIRQLKGAELFPPAPPTAAATPPAAPEPANVPPGLPPKAKGNRNHRREMAAIARKRKKK